MITSKGIRPPRAKPQPLSVDHLAAVLITLFLGSGRELEPDPMLGYLDDQVNEAHGLADAQRRAVERAEQALTRARLRDVRVRLPRPEKIRASAAGTVGMIDLVLEHLDDLHELANDRTRAAENLGRRGGPIDYALDNHGDPRARKLYVEAGWVLFDVLCDATEVLHPIVQFLKHGEETHAGRRGLGPKIPPEEVDAMLERQAARRERGEFTPARLVAQPTVRTRTREQLRTDLEALERAAQKVHPQRLTKAERARLTPLEQRAWEVAVTVPLAAGRGARVRPAGGWGR